MTVEDLVIAAAVLRIAPPEETLRHIDKLLASHMLALDWKHDTDQYKSLIVPHPRLQNEINFFLMQHTEVTPS